MDAAIEVKSRGGKGCVGWILASFSKNRIEGRRGDAWFAMKCCMAPMSFLIFNSCQSTSQNRKTARGQPKIGADTAEYIRGDYRIIMKSESPIDEIEDVAIQSISVVYPGGEIAIPRSSISAMPAIIGNEWSYDDAVLLSSTDERQIVFEYLTGDGGGIRTAKLIIDLKEKKVERIVSGRGVDKTYRRVDDF